MLQFQRVRRVGAQHSIIVMEQIIFVLYYNIWMHAISLGVLLGSWI